MRRLNAIAIASLVTALAFGGVFSSASAGDVPLGTTADLETVPPTDAESFKVSYQGVTLGGVEAKGIGLRNQGSGTIKLTEMPPIALVLKAFLYWQIMDNSEKADFKKVKFQNVDVTGELIGSGRGLCWSASSTFTYRADVTSLVTGAGNYKLENVASAIRDGRNAWGGYANPAAEGASLIVVYVSPLGELREVTIMDGFRYVGAADFTIPDALAVGVALPTVKSKLTLVGGDGQTNAGEWVDVNGRRLATNTFDGSDPQSAARFTYGNLWDTDTFDVTSFVTAGKPVTVRLGSSGDCIGLAAAALSSPLS